MSNVAIRVEGLGKRFRIGAPERYRTLRDSLTDMLTAPFRALRNGSRKSEAETIWALKDVSFEVKHGEVIGIIGRNGAGKSTLLKILSRITEPTEGHAEIHGRVGSLLEVGTGFHPELTGRENIFLNGAIIGMKRAEILRKFDEIVAFAGVERFVDTPVKHYSSGMYVRLAFGVAAHLESEVLLVDEVLAVGDAEFQKKCLAKIRTTSVEGRTILFVSHNMSAVRTVCGSAYVFGDGHLIDSGETNEVVDNYLASINTPWANNAVMETNLFAILAVSVRCEGSPVIKTFARIRIDLEVRAKTLVSDPGFYVGILSSEGQRLLGLDFKDFKTAPLLDVGEEMTVTFFLDNFPLLSGQYQLEIHTKDMATHEIEIVGRTIPFEVVDTAVYSGREIDHWYGKVAVDADAEFSRGVPASRPAVGELDAGVVEADASKKEKLCTS